MLEIHDEEELIHSLVQQMQTSKLLKEDPERSLIQSIWGHGMKFRKQALDNQDGKRQKGRYHYPLMNHY